METTKITKRPYIAPVSRVVRLAVSDDIAEQFPVNSWHSINEGDAKSGDFDADEWEDDEQTTGTGYNLWAE